MPLNNRSLLPTLFRSDNQSTKYDLDELPPEIALEEQAINRKQHIADLLFQQALQPRQGQMAGRFYVPPSWAEGLAQLGQAAAGAYLTHHLGGERKDLADQRQNMIAEAVKNYATKMTPSAATQSADFNVTLPGGQKPLPSVGGPMAEGASKVGEALGLIKRMPPGEIPPQQAAFTAPGAPAYTPADTDKRAAIAEAMASRIPGLQAMAQMDMQRMGQQEELKAQQAFQAKEHALTRETMKEEKAADRANRLAIADTQLQQMVMLKVITQDQADQMKKELATQADTTKRELASRDEATKRDIAKQHSETQLAIARMAADAKKSGQSRMPPAALKLQQEELDAIGTSATINADLQAVDKQLQDGKLDLGPMSNLMAKGRNLTGLSNESSRNLASFQASLEKLRNDSLRLNKGVQTEGDAVRAWDELISNINDPKLVRQRLAEITKLNERAANLRKMNVDLIRQNYGIEPLDTTPYSQQPSAIGTKPSGTPPPTGGGWSIKPLP